MQAGHLTLITRTELESGGSWRKHLRMESVGGLVKYWQDTMQRHLQQFSRRFMRDRFWRDRGFVIQTDLTNGTTKVHQRLLKTISTGQVNDT